MSQQLPPPTSALVESFLAALNGYAKKMGLESVKLTLGFPTGRLCDEGPSTHTTTSSQIKQNLTV